MFERFLSALKKFFTGSYIDEELDNYIISHNPTDAGQVEELERKFWESKIHSSSYY